MEVIDLRTLPAGNEHWDLDHIPAMHLVFPILPCTIKRVVEPQEIQSGSNKFQSESSDD